MKFATARLRPAADRRVRHPNGQLFAADGEVVPMSGFYRRLVRDGDLERVPGRQGPANRPAKSPEKSQAKSVSTSTGSKPA